MGRIKTMNLIYKADYSLCIPNNTFYSKILERGVLVTNLENIKNLVLQGNKSSNSLFEQTE